MGANIIVEIYNEICFSHSEKENLLDFLFWHTDIPRDVLENSKADIFLRDCQVTCEIVEDILNHNRISRKHLDWLHDLQVYQYKELQIFPASTESIESYYVDLSKHTLVEQSPRPGGLPLAALYRELYQELVCFLTNRQNFLRRCAAEDCNRIFTPAPQGSEQKFCSAKCRNRTWARKHPRKHR